MVSCEETKETMDYKKNSFEADITIIRSFHLNQIKRYSVMNTERLNLLKKNGGSSVQNSDIIELNVGGTKMKIARRILTVIKGSRLEALFSGRWENKLLRDDHGCVFMDLDITYFEKIVEHLYTVKECQDKEEHVDRYPELPKFSDDYDQAIFDTYVEFFGLRNNMVGQSSPDEPVPSQSNETIKTLSYVDLLDAFEKEKQELSDLTKKLDAMEKELEEERHFVSFFTTKDEPVSDEHQRKNSNEITNNDTWFSVVGSNMMDSNVSSSKSTEKSSSDSSLTIISNDHIVKLWIEGKLIPVKHSTLCHFKDSDLARRFNDVDWLKKRTFQSCYDGSIVVFLEYPIEAFQAIINHLRLYAISESAGIVSDYDLKEIRNPHYKKVLQEIVTALFGQVKDKFEGANYPKVSQIYDEAIHKVNEIKPALHASYDTFLKTMTLVASALNVLRQNVYSIITHFVRYCTYMTGKLSRDLKKSMNVIKPRLNTGCDQLLKTMALVPSSLYVLKQKVYGVITQFSRYCCYMFGILSIGLKKAVNAVFIQMKNVYHRIGRFFKNCSSIIHETLEVFPEMIVFLIGIIYVSLVLSSSACNGNFTDVLDKPKPGNTHKMHQEPRSIIISNELERKIIHEYLVKNNNEGVLLPGQILKSNDKIYSANGKYMLTYDSDCKLVLYDQEKNSLWSRKAHRCGGDIIMKGNGDLIMYDRYGSVSFSTNTGGNPGARLKVEDSGNLRIIGPNSEELWWRDF